MIININKEEYIFGTSNGYIQIWNFKTKTLKSSIKAHDKSIESLLFINNSIITASKDNTVKIWDISNGSNLFTFEEPDMMDPSKLLNWNDYIIVIYETSIYIWNYKTGEKINSRYLFENILNAYILDDSVIINLDQKMVILDIISMNIISEYDFSAELILPNKEIISISENKLLKLNIINNISEIIYESKYQIKEIILLSNGMIVIMSDKLIEVIN